VISELEGASSIEWPWAHGADSRRDDPRCGRCDPLRVVGRGRDGKAAVVAAGPLEIENRLHRVRDGAWDKNRGWTRMDSGPQAPAASRHAARTRLGARA
jgi:hypothetical protein